MILPEKHSSGYQNGPAVYAIALLAQPAITILTASRSSRLTDQL
jgi:hypothetical protein